MMITNHPIPTPRHDKLLVDEACNYDVPWSEEFQKLERENIALREAFKALHYAVAKEHDSIREPGCEFCDAIIASEQALSLTPSEISEKWVKREVLERVRFLLEESRPFAGCTATQIRYIEEATNLARTELGKGEK
jgi:hypothetical protein